MLRDSFDELFVEKFLGLGLICSDLLELLSRIGFFRRLFRDL